jgi:hypothetical protein
MPQKEVKGLTLSSKDSSIVHYNSGPIVINPKAHKGNPSKKKRKKNVLLAPSPFTSL